VVSGEKESPPSKLWLNWMPEFVSEPEPEDVDGIAVDREQGSYGERAVQADSVGVSPLDSAELRLRKRGRRGNKKKQDRQAFHSGDFFPNTCLQLSPESVVLMMVPGPPAAHPKAPLPK